MKSRHEAWQLLGVTSNLLEYHLENTQSISKCFVKIKFMKKKQTIIIVFLHFTTKVEKLLR